MVIGLLTIELQVPASASLKDKRQVLRSVIDRLRQDFNVSVAEVGHQDSWQLATLAVAAVSADVRYLQGQLARVVQCVEDRHRDLVLVDYETEFL